MIKSFSVLNTDLKRGNSLVPEFYYFANIVRKENEKRGIEYFSLSKLDVSDGEHSAIPRNSIGGKRYLYGRNIREGCVDFDPISDDPYIYEEDYESFKRIHLKENDVLVPIVGTIGKSAIYKKEYIGEAGIPRHIARIRFKEKCDITPEYLSVFFRSKYGKIQLLSLTTGNIQPLLSLKNLKTVDVPIISKELIDKITQNEELANKYLIDSNKLLDEAQELFYSSLGFDIRKIKGDLCFETKSNEVFMNDSWAPSLYGTLYSNILIELKKNQKTSRLGDLIQKPFNGIEVGSENYIDYLDKEDGNVPFIRTSDIVNYSVDLYPDFYADYSEYDSMKNKIKEGDVIFTKDGKVGATGLIMKNDICILSSGIEILRLNQDAIDLGLTPEYLFIVLKTKEVGYYEAIRRTVVASTIPHLRPEKMKEMEIPILSKEQIAKITELVKKAYDLKDKRTPLLFENDRIFSKAF